MAMKIIGIGANYYDAQETKGPKPVELMIFSKPSTSLASGSVFHYPKYIKEVFYEMEIVLKISRRLKDVTEDQAFEAFDEICLGIDWTAKDLQKQAKSKGWPWAFAKGFDEAAFLGEWLPVSHFDNVRALDLTFKVNGEVKLKGNTMQVIASYEQIISETSKYMTLEPGDLIMTGTPPKPGPIHKGDHCEGYIGDTKYLDFEVV